MLNIIVTGTFEKNVKKIVKKDKLLHEDLQNLFSVLVDNPREGISLGNNCYKIRVKNSSAGKGKSGGYRVISYFWDKEILGLLTIYSKNDKENIFEKEIEELILELACAVKNND